MLIRCSDETQIQALLCLLATLPHIQGNQCLTVLLCSPGCDPSKPPLPQNRDEEAQGTKKKWLHQAWQL